MPPASPPPPPSNPTQDLAKDLAKDLAEDLARPLLAWYDRNRRSLPWRAEPGATADPYAVWLSEIMLQQTTVAAVIPYFAAFLARWPRIEMLAAADLDDVLHAWQGLGYYARARNLHRCAQSVVSEHGGRIPETEAALKRLPGIGSYTAAAIAAIAFEADATPVDANVARVLARLFAIEEPMPGARGRLEALARTLTPARRRGDFAQALMDLGASVCTVKAPRCEACPWMRRCRAFAAGAVDAYPLRTQKPERPTRHGVAFWLVRADGAVYLRRRPSRGLLGGLMEVPSTNWRPRPWTRAEAIRAGGLKAEWRAVAGEVHHTFTHFALCLEVLPGSVGDGEVGHTAGEGGIWCPPSDFGRLALPTLMRKVAGLMAGKGG